MDIPIVYEDERVLIVDKPAGIVVHPDRHSKEETLVDWLLAHKKVPADVGEPWRDESGHVLARPGIVHRLDKDTSGILVIAKTQTMYEWLKQQFKERTVKKTYEAIVRGEIIETSGTITAPLGRSRVDFRKRSVVSNGQTDARDARTEYEVLARMKDSHSRLYTHVLLRPHTGRTHQLRVHMQSIHHPILCDRVYGGKEAFRESAEGVRFGAHVFTTLALRAVHISFPLPEGGVCSVGCKGYIL